MNSVKKLILIASLCAVAPVMASAAPQSAQAGHDAKHVIVGSVVAAGALAGGAALTYKNLGTLLKGGMSLLQNYPKQSLIAGGVFAGGCWLANKVKPGWYKPTLNGVTSCLAWIGKQTCSFASWAWNCIRH